MSEVDIEIHVMEEVPVAPPPPGGEPSLLPRRFGRAFWVIVAIIVTTAGIAMAMLAGMPHAITIIGPDAPTGTSALAVTSTSSTSTAIVAGSPTVALTSASDFTFTMPTDVNADSLAMVLPLMNATFTPAAYDIKALAIANLPAPHVVWTGISTNRVSSTVDSPLARLWPVVSAPFPETGALLPFNRIVAYYGNFYSTQMGVLGQYPPNQVLAMLASTTAMWAAADPSTPVIPAIQYIAVTAQGSAGADGKYRLRMPSSQIEQAIQMANEAHGIAILDVQVGLSNVQTEVPLLAPYLKLPQVELALDPEFSMKDGARPGTEIGTMDATDINFAAQFLANLAQTYHLPPKILVIHRFTQAMVTHYQNIAPSPDVQIVMDMDGFGSPARKFNTYDSFIQPEPVDFTGIKLFYHNDVAAGGHLLTPAEVLKLTPNPSYVQYQ